MKLMLGGAVNKTDTLEPLKTKGVKLGPYIQNRQAPLNILFQK
jgi:hypothetical protein